MIGIHCTIISLGLDVYLSQSVASLRFVKDPQPTVINRIFPHTLFFMKMGRDFIPETQHQFGFLSELVVIYYWLQVPVLKRVFLQTTKIFVRYFVPGAIL